jgi:hypothetical protein
MRKTIHFLSSLSWLAAGLLFIASALMGCQARELPRKGVVDFALGADGTRCESDGPPPGSLVLATLDGSSKTSVSGLELWPGRSVRREVPPGLYALSWEPSSSSEQATTWEVRRPAVVMVLAGRTTTLSLNRNSRACLELSRRAARDARATAGSSGVFRTRVR